MKRPALPVSDQIRAIIDACGVTRYQLAKLTNIQQSAIARFMSGERGLSTTALDAIGQVLELEVRSRRRSRS